MHSEFFLITSTGLSKILNLSSSKSIYSFLSTISLSPKEQFLSVIPLCIYTSEPTKQFSKVTSFSIITSSIKVQFLILLSSILQLCPNTDLSILEFLPIIVFFATILNFT